MVNNDKGMSPVAAGVVGAVVGAAVGATAVVLSEEKNRKAIGKSFNEVKGKVENMAASVGDSVQNVASQGEKKVKEAKKAVKSKL
jgi:gas vesicle protein